MKLKHIIIIILFLASNIFYYHLTSPSPSITTAKAIRAIDGDTLELNDSTRIRLLGINTPESNQPFYQEAKSYLATFQNQIIKIESHGTDKYGRTLAYIFQNQTNINAQILSQGLATLYYYDKDSYYKTLKNAEEFARTNQLGLWQESPNSACITIKSFSHNEPEHLTLQNTCNHEINLTYKDDATHIYNTLIEPNSEYTKTFSHIWNTEGDSIYIYDTKGLILFHRY